VQLVSEVDAPQVGVIAAGGALRKRTRSLVGPEAVRGFEAHFADQVMFSVGGITPDGHLTDPDALEAEVKRAMVRRPPRGRCCSRTGRSSSAPRARGSPTSQTSACSSPPTGRSGARTARARRDRRSPGLGIAGPSGRDGRAQTSAPGAP
jgi:hypothetical protein